MPVLRRIVHLEDRGVRAAGVWLFFVGEETRAADVLVMEDEGNKGVCVEAVVVQRLEAEREDWGGDKHAGTGFVVADGRSEARGSDTRAVLGVRGPGGGGEEGGAWSSDDCVGEYSDVGGKKYSGGGDDGDKRSASSLSISLSNFTSPGGSTPYLREGIEKKIHKIYTINLLRKVKPPI